MNVQQLVALNLRKIRVEASVSQEALAVDAEIDRTCVSRLERGLENPTIGVLERIANALDAKIVDFFKASSPGEKKAKPLPSGRRPRK